MDVAPLEPVIAWKSFVAESLPGLLDQLFVRRSLQDFNGLDPVARMKQHCTNVTSFAGTMGPALPTLCYDRCGGQRLGNDEPIGAFADHAQRATCRSALTPKED